MQITLYRRSYPVADAPVSLSLLPHPAGQRHTFTAGGRMYEAELSAWLIVVPDDARVDGYKNVLLWAGDKGLVRSTAKEVFDLAEARASGFRMAH